MQSQPSRQANPLARTMGRAGPLQQQAGGRGQGHRTIGGAVPPAGCEPSYEPLQGREQGEYSLQTMPYTRGSVFHIGSAMYPYTAHLQEFERRANRAGIPPGCKWYPPHWCDRNGPGIWQTTQTVHSGTTS